MKNKVLHITGFIIAVLALFFVSKNVSLAPMADNSEEDSQPLLAEKMEPKLPEQSLPFSNTPKDAAWAVFQKYLAYNKSRDLEGVRSVVYKMAPVCEDPKTRIDCEIRMGNAHSYGSALKKEDFTNVWSDEKQIILASDFSIEEDDFILNRARAIIFFVKGETGLKMLSFSPFKGATTSKGTASKEELNDRIIRYTEDEDEDGLADYIEECIPAEMKETCIPTSPKIRDTDGDGWWDGVEALM